MKVIEIAFTGFSVTDLKRARRFYEGVLGLKVARVFGDGDSAWIEYDIGPSTIAIGNLVADWKPAAAGGTVGLEVDDFGKAIKQLKSNKVAFISGPFETPVCHMAVVADPDGNMITIHKRKG